MEVKALFDRLLEHSANTLWILCLRIIIMYLHEEHKYLLSETLIDPCIQVRVAIIQ